MLLELPSLECVSELTATGSIRYGSVPFEHRAAVSGSTTFFRPLYRLVWPGECAEAEFSPDIGISTAQLRSLGLSVGRVNTVSTVAQRDGDAFERALPYAYEGLQLHLAVNRWWSAQYFGSYEEGADVGPLPRVRFPVGPLSAQMVNDVLDARFALDAEDYSACSYLVHMMRNAIENPMLARVRRSLGDVRELMHLNELIVTWLRFLEDHLYDHEAKWWKRDRKLWAVKAHLFYSMSTGHHWPVSLLRTAGVLNNDASVNQILAGDGDGEELLASCSEWLDRQEEREENAYQVVRSGEARSVDEQDLQRLSQEEVQEDQEEQELLDEYRQQLASDEELKDVDPDARLEVDFLRARAGLRHYSEDSFRQRAPDPAYDIAVFDVIEQKGQPEEGPLKVSIEEQRHLLVDTMSRENGKGVSADMQKENLEKRLRCFLEYRDEESGPLIVNERILEIGSLDKGKVDEEEKLLLVVSLFMPGDNPTLDELFDDLHGRAMELQRCETERYLERMNGGRRVPVQVLSGAELPSMACDEQPVEVDDAFDRELREAWGDEE